MRTLVGVAGMVGTGKTTLAEALGQRFGLSVALESVDEDNPWLALYYGEPDGMRRYGLELQLHFLALRMRQLRRMDRDGGPWIIDRTFYEDAEVFARGVHERGHMSALQWELYQAIYTELCQLPAARPPALLIYLCGPLDVVESRIRERARPSEREVPTRYWAELQSRYARWIRQFDLCPVLRVDVREYDVVTDPDAALRIAELARRETGVDLTALLEHGP